MYALKSFILLGVISCLNASIVLAASAGAGDSLKPESASFKVLAQKEFPEGSYGPGYPVIHRVLETTSFESASMKAGSVTYGSSYTGYGEFSDMFIADATREGTHTLEVGFGAGYHIKRILEAGKGKHFTLSLNEVSQENIDALKSTIKERDPGQKINLYKAFDGRKFLNSPAIAPGSLDAVGLFHVMHFWTPSEILSALTNIHAKLKVGGVLTMTLSANTVIATSEYATHALTHPWTGSVFAMPLTSESYKYTNGSGTGQIVTHLPAGALAELLTAFGFEVEHAAYYVDFYPQNLPTRYVDFLEYVGARARKAGEPDPKLLSKWIKHAATCETVKNTNHSEVLYDTSSAPVALADANFKREQIALSLKRRMDLWNSVKAKDAK